MKKILYCFIFPVLVLSTYSQHKLKGFSGLQLKKMYGYETNSININNIDMGFSNNGASSWSSGEIGFHWPRGSTNTLTFGDGMVIAGIESKNFKIAGSIYSSSLQPGCIIRGKPADPTDPNNHIFKIQKNWEKLPDGKLKDQFRYDYENWPVEYGAPYVEDINGKKTPLFLGDQQIWFGMNGLNKELANSFYNSTPMDLEVQCLIWANNSKKYLENVIFKKYSIINKGQNDLDDAYLAYWSDPDIGDGSDDYCGCDTISELGYAYNGNQIDKNYGSSVPALGYLILQGPIVKSDNSNEYAFWNFGVQKGYKNLPMTSFTFTSKEGDTDYFPPATGTFGGGYEMYNMMKGLKKSGEKWIDPTNNKSTGFLLSGDPVTKRGWIDGPTSNLIPSDRSIILSSGPFKLAKLDTQEFVIAIIVGDGIDRLSSISVLKFYSLHAKSEFQDGLTKESSLDQTVNFDYLLTQNYPSPFNSATTIKFKIPKYEFTSLKIYDALGKEITTLLSKYLYPGEYQVNWDATNHPSGTYFYKLSAGQRSETKKLVLIK
jgi:hypothetical protein